MYCKIFISGTVENVLSVLTDMFGRCTRHVRTYYFTAFDTDIRRNKEADENKKHTYPDGFLYYETVAEFEIYSDYVEVTNNILRRLWARKMPAAAVCDYESELIKCRE